MTKGVRKEQQVEKKEKGGCVSAILQIFDLQQLFIHHKRLPPPPPVITTTITRDIRCHDDVQCSSGKQQQQHHRSTSVIARLMGLEPLPNSTSTSTSTSTASPIKQSGTEQLRTRGGGIDEASKDLETLKQILEALHLKGVLLHSPPVQSCRSFVPDESPIVVKKLSTPVNQRTGNGYSQSSGGGGNQILRCYEEKRRSSLPVQVQPKPLSLEAQKENQRLTLIHTLKPNHTRTNAPDSTVNHQTRRTKKPTPSILDSSSSSITTSTDSNERSKIEGYKDGRTLLQRCDKLLNSIAQMNAIDATQPSPVSVLDYKDQSSPPSPVTTLTKKHKLHFKAETDIAGELEDGFWSSIVLPIRSKCEEVPDDSDYVYITDVLRASHFFQEDCDMFSLLETQQFIKGNDTSKVSRLQRKLIFDTVNEILDRNRRLPPWKAISLANEDTTKLSLDRVWLEFQRIRECVHGEDLFETICHVLKKDLERNGISGWGDRPVEMSDMILDIERLIFKDLISETIRDLAVLASRTTYSSFMPRRKLVF